MLHGSPNAAWDREDLFSPLQSAVQVVKYNRGMWGGGLFCIRYS